MSFRCLSLAALLLLGTSAGAQTVRYVSDELVVNLRTGQTNGHAIVRMLAAGTPVEVLEESEESGYSRVRLRDRDAEGWVLTQYLTPEPIARDKLAAAERELDRARTRVADLEMQLAALAEDAELVSKKLEQRESTNAQLSAELADIRSASANAVALRDENVELKRTLAEREEEMQRLLRENDALSSRELERWFLTGAGVLFGGIVLGLILPKLRRRRRSEW